MPPDVTITADIIDPSPGPALSATSDMPVIGEEAPATPPAPEPAAEPAAEAEAAAADEGTEAEGEQPPAEAPATEGEQDAPPRRRNGINERFSDLTAAKRAAEAEAKSARERAEAAERALQEALSRIPKPEEAKPEEPPPPPPRPRRDEFDDPDTYEDALVEWSATRAAEKLRAEQDQHTKAQQEAAERNAAEQGRKSAFETVLGEHSERVKAAVEKYPDYTEVTESDNVAISEPMAMAILQNENGPDVAYYLGKNPDVAARIADMVIPGVVFPEGHPHAGRPVPNVQRQLIEMGKVFAEVAKEQTPAPKPPPPPPAPITPVRSTTNRAVDLEPGEMSMEEYANRRMPVLQSERRASGIFGARSN